MSIAVSRFVDNLYSLTFGRVLPHPVTIPGNIDGSLGINGKVRRAEESIRGDGKLADGSVDVDPHDNSSACDICHAVGAQGHVGGVGKMEVRPIGAIGKIHDSVGRYLQEPIGAMTRNVEITIGIHGNANRTIQRSMTPKIEDLRD